MSPDHIDCTVLLRRLLRATCRRCLLSSGHRRHGIYLFGWTFRMAKTSDRRCWSVLNISSSSAPWTLASFGGMFHQALGSPALVGRRRPEFHPIATIKSVNTRCWSALGVRDALPVKSLRSSAMSYTHRPFSTKPAARPAWLPIDTMSAQEAAPARRCDPVGVSPPPAALPPPMRKPIR